MERFLLVYDADCGACANFKRVVETLDVHGRIEYLPLADADRRGLLEGVPPALRHKSFHLISPEGELSSGQLAIPKLIAALPAGRLTSQFVAKTPGGISCAAFIYSVFSRLHEADSCSS